MFRIRPIQSADEQIECAKACGTEYRAGFFAYSMRDDETDALMGFSQFEINAGYGYITDIKSVPGLDDFEAMFILGRATMNFIDTCGAHTAISPKDIPEKDLMISLGFRDDGSDTLKCDMTHMFNGECHSH